MKNKHYNIKFITKLYNTGFHKIRLYKILLQTTIGFIQPNKRIISKDRLVLFDIFQRSINCLHYRRIARMITAENKELSFQALRTIKRIKYQNRIGLII